MDKLLFKKIRSIKFELLFVCVELALL